MDPLSTGFPPIPDGAPPPVAGTGPPDAGETIVPYDAYRDLLEQSYDQVGTCWGLVVEVGRRMGRDVGGDLTDLWEPVGEPGAGDLVMMRDPTAPPGRPAPHGGIYLGQGRVLHAANAQGCPTVARLADLKRGGAVRGYYRHAGRFRAPLIPRDAEKVTVVFCPEVTSPFKRTIDRAEWVPDAILADYAPPDANVAVVGGRLTALTECAQTPVKAGTVLVFATMPAIALLPIIALGIGIILTFLSTLFLPTLPSSKEKDEISTPTFDIGGIRNTAAVGIAQPLVYGEHRTGGNFIGSFVKADTTGRSILYLLIFLSRGPVQDIGGITTDQDELSGEAIPNTIEINGSPAKNYGAFVSLRMGDSNQDPIPGFGDLTIAVPYSKTLKPTEPFTHETDNEITSFDLIINYPLGLFNIDISGGGTVGPRTVSYTVRFRVKGTTTWTTLTYQHTGARRGPFTRMISVFPLARAKYEIEITRFAAGTGSPPSPPWPEVDSDKESRSDLTVVNEIDASASLAYPGKALIGLRVSGTDQLSGGNVTVTVVMKGIKVWIWDGVSETAPAFGAVQQYTTKPAWCILDMLLNPNYGLKRNGRLSLNKIGLAELKTWADHSVLQVSDGRGGLVDRASLDVVIDEVQLGWQLIADLAISHWGRMFIAGDEIRVVVEKTANPVAIFGMGNLRDVVVSYKGRRSRPNVVEVQYFNEEANYERDIVTWPPGGEVGAGDVLVKETYQAFGVTRACQAQRLAHFRWNHHQLSKRNIAGRAGIEAIHLIPGDIAEYQHDSAKPSTAQSGRVLGATTTTVILDHDLSIGSGTNKISVRTDATGQDVIQERTLTNGIYLRGDSITITSAWDVGDVPVRGDVYHAGPVSTYYRSYRLLSLETDPGTLEREITAAEYNAAIYDDDPGNVPTFTDLIPNPNRIPDPVTGVHLSETTVISTDGSVQDRVRVEWNPAETWHGADVWYRLRDPGGSVELHEWCCAVRALRTVVEVGPFARGGRIEIAVTALSASGAHASPEDAPRKAIFVRGSRRRPDPPLAVSAEVVGATLFVKITPPANTRDVAGYEVRYGSTWGGSIGIGKLAPADCSFRLTFTNAQTILVKSIARNGLVSAQQVSTTVTPVVLESVYDLDTTQTESPVWGGTKTDTVVTAGNLLINGSPALGSYQIPNVAVGNVARLAIEATCGLANVVRLGNECAFRATDPEAQVPGNAFYLTGFEIRASGHTGLSLTGIPGNGLVAYTMNGYGEPIDVITELEPGIQWADSAAPDKDFDGVERDITQLRATLTLRRPHSRYQPRSTFMESRIYAEAPSGGSTPTGTGFRHVTAGVEDAAAKLVAADDMTVGAYIANQSFGG